MKAKKKMAPVERSKTEFCKRCGRSRIVGLVSQYCCLDCCLKDKGLKS